mmetsp:Transcript_89473/g.255539  ORF Transcript_89473/g.255539 Transcript_89473/m.255539 type:complete len:178 (-) Transcript_89473:131-664(-)
MTLDSPFDQGVSFVYVSDVEKARSFYNGALQLPIALEQRDENGALKAIIFSVSGSCFFGVVLVDPESLKGTGVQADGITLTLAVPTKLAVDEWAAKLLRAGVALEKQPTLNARYEIYHIFFRDPDNHLCEVQCFLSPRWPGLEEQRRAARTTTVLAMGTSLLVGACIGLGVRALRKW